MKFLNHKVEFKENPVEFKSKMDFEIEDGELVIDNEAKKIIK